MLDIRSVGSGYSLTGETLCGQLYQAFSMGLAMDNTEVLFAVVKEAKRILHVLDNVGEIAIGRVLIDEIKRYGAKVVAR